MKRIHFIFTLAVFCLLLTRGIAADSSQSAEDFTVNGLKVIVKSNPANEIVSAQLYVRGGALNLNEQNQGIESLIFNSAMKGSENYSEEKINHVLDKTAAQINSSSNRDFSSVNLRCIRRYFDETWDVFADIVMNPTFDPAAVEIEREKMLSNIRQRKDNPDVLLRDMANDLFYKAHPYQHHPGGTEETISNITIDEMRRYLKQHLKTSRLLLVVVGDVDKDELRQKVETSFGKLPQGNFKPHYPDKVVHDSANLVTTERDLPTNYIMGLFTLPGPHDPDFYSAIMAMDILRTRVWEEVRTKRNLSYAPSAFNATTFANWGAIYVTAVEPDTTIKVMLAELEKLTEDPVSKKDLRDRVTTYITRYYLNNETNAAQGRFMATFELSGLGYKESEKMVENLRNVTVKDVKAVAQKYFHNLQFVVLGNPQLIDRSLFTSR